MVKTLLKSVREYKKPALATPLLPTRRKDGEAYPSYRGIYFTLFSTVLLLRLILPPRVAPVGFTPDDLEPFSKV